MNFRKVLRWGLSLGLVFGFASFARAASYPSSPIHIIVPYSAGGSSDVPMRAIAQQMSKQMKQSIVIENKLGAGSTLGTEYVAHAAPDGYTLLLASNPQAWASALFRHLSFDPVADFEPISLFTREPGVLVINPEMSVQTYGAMVKSPSGYPVQSPYVSIANRQTEIMMRIASEFGFTPASRSRISTPGQRQPNLFDMLENVSGERDGSKGDDE